jgi:hypothetical protein
LPPVGLVRARKNTGNKIAGWVPSPVAVGDYEDYCMTPPGAEQPVAGICHARGQGRYSIIEDPAGAVTGLFERR